MLDRLQNLVEPFIYQKLEKSGYEIKTGEATQLLTWNRLDLAFKLSYLDLKEHDKSFADTIYQQDLKAQTLGKFVEFGNEKKDSFLAYTESFEQTLSSIEKNGFDELKSIIPLARDYSILNGSHRLASSIHLKRDVSYIVTEQEPIVVDYNYYYKRDVDVEVIEQVVRKFIECSPNNIYMAFLWPSGLGRYSEAESLFRNIVFKKNLSLTPNGGFNLLIELYKHMDWGGEADTGFQGIKKKLLECFPVFECFTVIIFQEESIDEVRTLKEKVRQIHNIGYSSIHITDTKSEVIRISNLIFNKNGLHFLKHANPYKYPQVSEEIGRFNVYLQDNKISKEQVVIDGSIILALYGIRKNQDIDFLAMDASIPPDVSDEFEQHDSELVFHRQLKERLILDPRYYFQYLGIKFISFDQLYTMKKNRNEMKDRVDCDLMESLLDRRSFRKIISRFKQYFFYTRIKLENNTRQIVMISARKLGIYNMVRWIYRKIKGHA